jgi:hypothetical protein
MHPRPDPGTLEIPTIPLRKAGKAGKAVSARVKVGVALAAESRGVFGVVVRTTIITIIITDVVAMAAAAVAAVVAVAVAAVVVVVVVVVVAVAIEAIGIVVIARAIRMKIASANPLN